MAERLNAPDLKSDEGREFLPGFESLTLRQLSTVVLKLRWIFLWLTKQIGKLNMDLSFICDEQKFNYRVAAIIIDDHKILAMHDERSPYFYLPGGRVTLGETAESAISRELREELHITAKIVRPLWLNQAFFTERIDKLRYHELCIYFLIDVAKTDLLERGNRFIMTEGKRTHVFEWLEFDRLKDEYFYPLFLKKEIFNLPQQFTIRTEIE